MLELQLVSEKPETLNLKPETTLEECIQKQKK